MREVCKIGRLASQGRADRRPVSSRSSASVANSSYTSWFAASHRRRRSDSPVHLIRAPQAEGGKPIFLPACEGAVGGYWQAPGCSFEKADPMNAANAAGRLTAPTGGGTARAIRNLRVLKRQIAGEQAVHPLCARRICRRSHCVLIVRSRFGCCATIFSADPGGNNPANCQRICTAQRVEFGSHRASRKSSRDARATVRRPAARPRAWSPRTRSRQPRGKACRAISMPMPGRSCATGSRAIPTAKTLHSSCAENYTDRLTASSGGKLLRAKPVVDGGGNSIL